MVSPIDSQLQLISIEPSFYTFYGTAFDKFFAYCKYDSKLVEEDASFGMCLFCGHIMVTEQGKS